MTVINYKSIKKIAAAFCLAVFSSVAAQTTDNRTFMQEANKQSVDGNYAEAIKKYESVLDAGYENATLYYNLGYAYYKSGQLSKAIVNLERAKRLSPNDEDIQHNLDIAYSQTVDKIDELRPVFFVRWIESFKRLLSSDAWGAAFVVCLTLLFACIFAFLFAKSTAFRKLGFFAGIAMVIFCIVSFSFASSLSNEQTDRSVAVISTPSVTVTTSPDDNGTELVVLHEGTKVNILSRIGEWCEVRLSDGNVGWINEKDLEMI